MGLRRFLKQAFLGGDSKAFAITQQVIFAVLLLLAVFMLVMFRSESVQPALVGTGMGLLAAATATAFLRRPKNARNGVYDILLPLLDFAAVNLCRLGTLPDGGPLSVLNFFPAIWLVARFRVRGAVVAAAGVIVFYTVPTVIMSRTLMDPAQFLVFSVLPVTVLMVSALVVGLYERLNASRLRTARALERQRELGEAARRTSRLLTSIGKSLNVGVLVLDPEGNHMMSNTVHHTLLAVMSPPDVSDRGESGFLIHYADGVTPIPREKRPIQRALRGESFENMLLFVGTPGPEQRAISVSARTVLGETGGREAIVLVSYDVTDTQRMIHEREEFIATVSHELRTPLTSIVGYTDLAMDEIEEAARDDADDVLASYLEIVRRNAEQLSGLVEDLLLEQQSRRGTLRLRVERVRLDLLAAHAVDSLRPAAQAKNIQLQADLGEQTTVMGDSQRLEQVLNNLVSNAVKYTRPGGHVEVSVSTEGPYAELCVADDGPGLDEEDVARLFTPFFRAGSARRSAERGAGLGLSVSKTIVEAHQGHISVDTAPGAGAAFRVRIPQGALQDLV